MEKKTAKTVLIYDSQWAIIDRKAAEVGSPENTSAGLRALIAEYQRLKGWASRSSARCSSG